MTEGRAEIAVKVRERLQQYLVAYTTGINVQKVNIDDASPPSQVQEAFDDVIKAERMRSVLKMKPSLRTALCPRPWSRAANQGRSGSLSPAGDREGYG